MPEGVLIRVPEGVLIRVPEGVLIRVPGGVLIKMPGGTGKLHVYGSRITMEKHHLVITSHVYFISCIHCVVHNHNIDHTTE